MRWLTPGLLFAVVWAGLMFLALRDWYHSDALTGVPGDLAWDDAFGLMIYSFLATPFGVLLSLVGVKKARRGRWLPVIAWASLIFNLLLWPLAYGLIHWMAWINTGWLRSLALGIQWGVSL